MAPYRPLSMDEAGYVRVALSDSVCVMHAAPLSLHYTPSWQCSSCSAIQHCATTMASIPLVATLLAWLVTLRLAVVCVARLLHAPILALLQVWPWTAAPSTWDVRHLLCLVATLVLLPQPPSIPICSATAGNATDNLAGSYQVSLPLSRRIGGMPPRQRHRQSCWVLSGQPSTLAPHWW